ncbi:nlpC/P60 family protein [Mycobacterium xenopi 3993]|nr:nlpC/P60 family protein [Mycobacterium xenopi 3993]
MIRRASSQLGVPYSWGGGTLQGPAAASIPARTRSGSTVRADPICLRRGGRADSPFSGDQYNAGRHVPPSQAKRGDLIFYGPGGSQHVTLYLGNGQMLEASSIAGKVTVSPVRTEGMTPYVTRIIEY